ncbi:MAG: FAD-dependent oxidoreductase, partial [Firmicutes bacterium]|nr:FAD-dependent oxidoreductase [Bacillota bacterium]
LKSKPLFCAYNPEAGLEYLPKPEKNGEGKTALIAGGGPAGLCAAKYAAERGFKTLLCESASEPGGEFVLAALPPGKEDLSKFTANKLDELSKLGVEIKYNSPVTERTLSEIKPDLLFIAVGGKPLIPDIPGIKRENVYDIWEAMKGKEETLSQLKSGPLVIIGGGTTGLDAAEFLARKRFGNPEAINFAREFIGEDIPDADVPPDITVLEMTKSAGKDLGGRKWINMKRLKAAKVKILTNTRAVEIGEDYVKAETPEGEKIIPAKNIILACGNIPCGNALKEAAKKLGITCLEAGNAVKSGNAMDAIYGAFDALGKV